MRYISLLAVLCISATAFAQFDKDYTPVVSKGTLPKDFVTLSSEKYEEQRLGLSKEEKKKIRKSKETFLLQSNFGLDEILLSGKVLFNDPMAEYVNKVADKVLESDKQTRSKLRFYVLKSSAVNAFATNQGVIFVTVGMLAQLENEAQLAYILSHEVVHYKEQHAIEKYLEADNISKGKGAYKQMTFDEKFVSKCAFSKEQEKEADEKGLQIFLSSSYSSEEMIGVYDVLKYAYLPFDDVAFEKEFLENATLKIPERYLLTETKTITTADIDDDDNRSTHPNLKSRRKTTEESIKGADNTGKTTYAVSEQQFKQTREIARFELCRLYTLRHDYEKGLYNAYLMLKTYPENLYLRKTVANCLAGLAQYSTISEFYKVHYDQDVIEGQSQAVYFMMDKLDSVRGDLTIVALAYIAKLKKDYPNDYEVNLLFESQMKTLVKKNNFNYSDFSRFAPTPAAIVDSLKAVEKELLEKEKTTEKEPVAKSKYEKLREKEKGTDVKAPSVVSGGRYVKYAFVEFMNEEWFKTAFEKADDQPQNTDRVREVDIDEEMSTRKRYYDKRTYALGVNKIVVVDPYFARINARKKDKYKFLESEAGQVGFAERLKQNAVAAKLEMDVLNSKDLNEQEVQKVNEIALLEDYISDRLNHEKEVNLPFPEAQRLKDLAAKYNTDHFMWTGTISLTDRNRWNALLIMYSILFPPSLPFTLPPLINGGQYTMYFALMFNVETNKVELATYREIQNRTRGYLLDSHIYDVLNQVKSSPKKKK